MTMNHGSRDTAPDKLIDAAYAQTLARFKDEVARGERDVVAEMPEYRRRRRDYASLLRMGTLPEEARALAGQLLETHGMNLRDDARQEFERAVTQMLIRLYDAFIDSTADPSQGNR